MNQTTSTPAPSALFSPSVLGSVSLSNRIVMAPLTRSRAAAGNVPHALNARYYAQRASAGLIISEATQITPQGQGYPKTPGIHSPEQVAGWQGVTQAVHAHGGKIFLQLWHVGRVSHPLTQADGGLPVAPSAIRPAGEIYTEQGMKPFETPRALETEEIPALIEDFRRAAVQAKTAGFDGVELHCTSGYLPMQFMASGSNQRNDEYGGDAVPDHPGRPTREYRSFRLGGGAVYPREQPAHRRALGERDQDDGFGIQRGRQPEYGNNPNGACGPAD